MFCYALVFSLYFTVYVLYTFYHVVSQTLNQLNESVESFQRCVELEPDGETSLSMYLGSICELKMELASQERTRKLDNTQKKLDQFYENMELVQKLQHPLSETEGLCVICKRNV